MLALWILVAVIGTVVIAFGTIGRLSQTLATTASAAVYDIAEATDWVAERMPDEIAARLSHEDVMAVLYWNLGYMRAKGFATMGTVDEHSMAAALGGRDVVASEEDVVDALMAEAEASEREIEPVDLVTILELNGGYLEAIGAFGVRTHL